MTFPDSTRRNIDTTTICEGKNDMRHATAIGWRKALLAAALYLLAAGNAAASQTYYVFGRVYGGNPLAPGESVPSHSPLAGQPAANVLGEKDYLPSDSLSMVDVKLLDTTGVEHGNARILTKGSFYLTFSHPASRLEVTFEVRDAVTGELILGSGKTATEIVPGSNQRFLVTSKNGLAVGGGIPFAAGTAAALFTRVGLIEEADISPSGLAWPSNPPPNVPVNSRVPLMYRDAPFGGNLRIFGGFSRFFYPATGSGDYCYKIRIEDSNGGVTWMQDPLHKLSYTVPTGGGRPTATPEKLGPFGLPGSSFPDCYHLTPIAEAGNVFWSFPDLLAVWRTGRLDGTYTLTPEIYDQKTGFGIGLSAPSLTLQVDNRSVEVRFDSINVGALDLLQNACQFADLSGGGPLTFGYTARHPGGYLARYYLRATPNRGSALPGWPGKTYTGSPLSGSVPGDPGNPFSARATDFAGPCAYIFDLVAIARTTNGYGRINWRHDRAAYYVETR